MREASTLLSLVGALQQQQQPQQQPQLATLGQLTQGLGAQTLNPANSLAALGLGGLAGLGQPQQQAAVQQQPNLATMLSSLLSAQQSQTQGQQATQLQQVPQSQLQQRTQLGGLQNPMQASIQPLVSSALATQFGALSGSSTTGSLPAALANLQRMGVTQQPLANPAVGSTAPTSGTESVADILNRLKQLQQLHPGTSNPQSGAAGRG
ncbi:uncharacterized protein SPPG_09511 [Spizellomyces punctatus DAOM BR117]|uniref:Uncharacterized protein n=1 Tax=Spizellomyces punctatus (strain DAOM BR117) TaxID=645134 RepID=A0A0L0H716_SPIPD|nr:uncharacterized protein SPPG_09511 [Spizellomyces punctatus DAOM BR117]KNC96661.1 hypothetical protein SPPG_09511 [Spizellomyces punctatus DAOM BR117]|eukprot:XP_016604701.1 hypothetical protein SPPG_09511 [Spizellomyces punctatus DAOM BR117]